MPEHSPAPTPSRAIYGFAMFLSFKLFFIIYLIWAIIPNEWFRYIGITCLPDRYWCVTIPIFCLMTLPIFGFIIYPSLGFLMTPDVDDLRTIQDDYSKPTNIRPNCTELDKVGECVCFHKSQCLKEAFISNLKRNGRKSIPVISDLDMSEVSDLLYSK